MIINHNLSAMNAQRQMGVNQASATKSMEKLSSGLRINKAGDDAAGLAISEKMRGQIRGLDQASRNAQDGISMIQTAEGALNETHSILQRMKELSTQAANDTNTTDDRKEIQKEMNQLTAEINRIGNNTEFNTKKLLNGGSGDAANTKVSAKVTGTLATTNDMTSADATATFTIDGKDFSLTKDQVNSMGDMTDAAKIADVIKNAEDADGNKLSDVANVVVKDGDISITSKTAGKDSQVKVVYGGTDGTKLAADLGIADATEVKGLDQPSAAKLEGTLVSTEDMTSANATATITVDGKDYTLTKAQVNSMGDMSDASKITDALKLAEDADGNKLGDNADIIVEGGKLSITSKTTGNDSQVKVVYGGTDGTKLATDLGIADASENKGRGPEAEEGVAAPVGGFQATLQIGANQSQNFNIQINDMRGSALGLSGAAGGDAAGTTDPVTGASFAKVADTDKLTDPSMTGDEYALDVTDNKKASAAIKVIDKAIATVSSERSKLGAYQNRLEHTIANLGTASENLTSAESRVRDVDMAKEMMTFSKNNILSQAAQAMLAQANQQPQQVLQLLR